MKLHTTNYTNTFIAVADDCTATKGEIPPLKNGSRSVARIQYDILSKYPYQFTSDDVLFQVYAERIDLTKSELEKGRQLFFSAGQPCLRASPLTKRYGWGIHCNEEGKVAMYGVETDEYQEFVTNKSLKTVKAMRSKRT